MHKCIYNIHYEIYLHYTVKFNCLHYDKYFINNYIMIIDSIQKYSKGILYL